MENHIKQLNWKVFLGTWKLFNLRLKMEREGHRINEFWGYLHFQTASKIATRGYISKNRLKKTIIRSQKICINHRDMATNKGIQ